MPHFGASWSVVLGLSLAVHAHAQASEIWKCTDQRGRALYTSDKRETAGKKCELVSREVNVVPAQKQPPGAKSPSSFPKESPGDRAAAKSRQRETLERELTQEESMLADARRKLAEQEAVRSGDEKNYARVLERLKPYQDAVEVHQKNVDALKREIGNLSR